MLRCPPSRITLTSGDITDYERRLATRQSARLSKPNHTNVRLSPGPAGSTTLSLIPAEQNIGRKRAASSSSEATLHVDVEEGADGTWPIPLADNCSNDWAVDTTTNVQQPDLDQSALCAEAAKALNNAFQQQQSQATSSPLQDSDCFYGREQAVIDRLSSSDRGRASLPKYSIETEARQHVGEDQSVPHSTRCDVELKPGSASCAYPTPRQPWSELRAFSSARARRRHARSQDIGMLAGPRVSTDLVFTRGAAMSTLLCGQVGEAAPQVPRLVLPTECPQLSNPMLDPGAPVFMPRTRFGSGNDSTAESATCTTLEPRWSNIDTIHNSSDLRIRPSIEQNSEVSATSRHYASRGTSDPRDDFDQHVATAARFTRQNRVRAVDQNVAIPTFTSDFERSPLMRPSSSLNSYRGISDSLSPASRSTHVLQQPELLNRHQSPAIATINRRQSNFQIRYVSAAQVHGAAEQALHIRSVSPALSSVSRSTPNLLRPPSSTHESVDRDTHLSCIGTASRPPNLNRAPSMASVASGGRPVSRHSSREGLDAATEFLRMRNSPLDDLTERFSRLSAGRPRSVGRSWERSPRPRVSLLVGDPFRSEQPSNPLSTCREYSTGHNARTTNSGLADGPESAEELVALSLALPPSSPLRSSSDALPSTPPIHYSDATSPRSPLAQRSPLKSYCSPESAIKRKPVPTAAATPRVAVYDDSKPSSMQPQTPADVNKSKRSVKTRSDTAVDQSPVFFGRVMVSSPPAITERHRHRNTYPATTTSQAGGHTVTAVATPSTRTTISGLPGASHRGRRPQRSSEQAENDLEGHLHGLQSDRRTWLDRHVAGDLEVTPPREGRFERYLS